MLSKHNYFQTDICCIQNKSQSKCCPGTSAPALAVRCTTVRTPLAETLELSSAKPLDQLKNRQKLRAESVEPFKGCSYIHLSYFVPAIWGLYIAYKRVIPQ